MKLSVFLGLLLLASQAWTQIAPNADKIQPLPLGSLLPDVEIRTAKDQVQGSLALFQGKKTVLIIYRGGWCPYCNVHLSDVAKAEKELFDLGYQIIAISPDSPRNIENTAEADSIYYRLFSDSKGRFIQALGVAYQAPSSYDEIIEKSSEGENTGFLPVPSLLLIDAEGRIQFFHSNPNFKKRIKREAILEAAKKH